MSLRITPMPDTEAGCPPMPDDAGLGALRTERGNLPLESLDLRAGITGLLARTELTQSFHNPYDQPLEATYVFPLPDRAAVTGMRMTADDRVIDAVLAERGQARAEYAQAIAAGRRASIAEQERPDVFTMRVGNILPGERVTITLTLAGPLSYEDGAATFRFPLVVAPRYIPGVPLDGDQTGSGYALDTDAVPDASRITPPVLLPGFPYPVRLGIEITLDTGGLPLTQARCSLPVEEVEGGWRVRPGQRADRDLVLRLEYGDPVHTSHALAVSPDPDGEEGTFQLTLLPPTHQTPPRSRDVVLVLDRSGSMGGWKMTAARRAAARIVDTLTSSDRFAVLTFDYTVERPPTLPAGLTAGTDRHRFRAVEYLAGVQARGGTELLGPLREALALLATGDEGRDRVLVLVTDGQVGNEDQLLRENAAALAAVRVHTVGIDQAVNAGFLGRLAGAGGGRCELVESEDRLDEAMDRIHRRIGAPLVADLMCTLDDLGVVPDTVAPARIPDLYPGAPVVVTGRYRGTPVGPLRVRGNDGTGSQWHAKVSPSTVDNPALAAVWARAHLRDLEDRYLSAPQPETAGLEQRIIATSLRFSVLCRFTAYVAVDSRTVTDGTVPHRVTQPVEPAAGWDMLAAGAAAPGMAYGSATLDSMSVELEQGPAPMPAPPPPPPMAAPPPGGAPPPGMAIRFPAPTRASRRQRRIERAASQAPAPRPVAPAPAAELAAEAARLRAAASALERERRMLLADLATRLEALLRHRALRPTGTGTGTGTDAWTRLRRLLDELRDDAALRVPADTFAQLWTRMLTLLDELAGAPPQSGPPQSGPPARPSRGTFWKRS